MLKRSEPLPALSLRQHSPSQAHHGALALSYPACTTLVVELSLQRGGSSIRPGSTNSYQSLYSTFLLKEKTLDARGGQRNASGLPLQQEPSPKHLHWCLVEILGASGLGLLLLIEISRNFVTFFSGPTLFPWLANPC